MIVVLNNKCNLAKDDFQKYMDDLNHICTEHTMILCPSYVNIGLFSSDTIQLGAQNVSREDNGAHTGEVSAFQLKSWNVEYCIVGHSERRKDQMETNEDIHKKIVELLEKDIRPILCVGETDSERKNHQEENIIGEELDIALDGLSEEQLEKVIIAYEPIWSIGTGIVPTNQQIETVFNYIKQKYPNNKVLYGGSVNEENIEELKKCLSIDGYLLGGLSIKTEQLHDFVKKL